MWVIVFALTLIISMGGAYAYFTATATKKQSEMTTAIIKVALTDTQLTTTASGSTTATKILPGSTVQYSGKVVNTGNADMYALLEFNVYVDGSIIQTTYYTAAGTKLVFSDSSQKYETGATQIKENASQDFNLSFTFDKTLGNEYKNKTATLKVTALAIQYRNIASSVDATNLLLDGTSGNTETLPSNYTELAYIQANGAQYFDTDFQVTSSTDNYIIETSIMWTSTSSRQLMGYSTASGYFGIRTDYYDLGSKYDGRIKPDTTSYDKLRVVRSKTDNTHKLYVNNNLAGQSAVDTYSGKYQLFGLGSSYNCYCKMKYFKIYQDGAIKYNLVPAKDADGNVGMYDTVNNKFYTSTSGTAFVAGPVAEPTSLFITSNIGQSETKYGVAYTNNGDGSVTFNGTATTGLYFIVHDTIYLKSDHKYLLLSAQKSGSCTNNRQLYLDERTTDNVFVATQYPDSIFSPKSNVSYAKLQFFMTTNEVATNYTLKPRLYDLTEIYGAGNEPASIEQLKAEMPKLFNF